MVLLKELFDDAMKTLKQPKKGLQMPSKKTGVRNVFLMNCPRCKYGFMFQFRFTDENNKRRTIQSVDFDRLKERVEEMGMDWVVEDIPLMRKTLNKVEREIKER